MKLKEKINENTKIVKVLSTGKMYLARAMSYISIVNFGMILMIALENMKKNGKFSIKHRNKALKKVYIGALR